MIALMYSEQNEIDHAGSLIRSGGLVVFPTETVYGLGANALDGGAVARIFATKGRPSDNPLIVHVAELSEVTRVVSDVDPVARRLFEEFAPGPITVVLPARDDLPRIVTAGLNTVAVRMPAHPVARDFLMAAGVPVAAPSANRSGEPSPTTVEMARQSLGDGPDEYLDGGPCEVGLESTVLSLVHGDVRILRPGAVTAEDILEVLPAAKVRIVSSDDESLSTMASLARSPGVRHRHYQPAATVSLWETPGELKDLVAGHFPSESTLAVIAPESDRALVEDLLASASSHGVAFFYERLPDYARSLYAWLVEADEEGAAVVLANLPPSEGLGIALRDRLERAAGGR